MNSKEYDPLFSEYALPVIEKLQAEGRSFSFSDCTRFLISYIQSMPAWQIALPIIACKASGGSIDDGAILASAWTSLNLASEILDNVEDKELTADQFLTSPEVASNIATGLIFTSFQTLTSIQDANKANKITMILSN